MKKNNPEIVKKIGARCRQLRKQKGYTSAEKFAYEHDFARAAYSKYEGGVNIEVVTLVRLCEALGVTLREFFSQGID